MQNAVGHPLLPPPPGGWPRPATPWGAWAWLVLFPLAALFGLAWVAEQWPAMILPALLLGVLAWIGGFTLPWMRRARITDDGIRWPGRRLYWDEVLRFTERDEIGRANAPIASETRSLIHVVDVHGRALQLSSYTRDLHSTIMGNRSMVQHLNAHLAACLHPPALIFPVRLGADWRQSIGVLGAGAYMLLITPLAATIPDERWVQVLACALCALLTIGALWLGSLALFAHAEVSRDRVTVRRFGRRRVIPLMQVSEFTAEPYGLSTVDGRKILLGGNDFAGAIPWLNTYLAEARGAQNQSFES